jgi:hypothetical protein
MISIVLLIYKAWFNSSLQISNQNWRSSFHVDAHGLYGSAIFVSNMDIVLVLQIYLKALPILRCP